MNVTTYTIPELNLAVTQYWTMTFGFIYLIHNMLALYQIYDMIDYVKKHSYDVSNLQVILHQHSLDELPPWINDFNKDLKLIHNFPNYELLPVFTLSSHRPGDELNWHFDEKHTSHEHIKMVMYLTDSGGTDFRMEDGEILKLRPHQGDVVLFDLNYEHRGAAITNNKRKLLFGMRIGTVETH